jgi:hypothetical protein
MIPFKNFPRLQFLILVLKANSYPCSDPNGLLTLAFTVPPPNGLGLPSKLTRWIVLQKARRHTRRCSDSLYAHNFRIYFIPLSGVLFTFPSRYLSTIDRKTYLALEGGPSGFRQGFTCPVLLDTPSDKSDGLVITRFPTLCIPGFHGFWPAFPNCSARTGNFLPCTD